MEHLKPNPFSCSCPGLGMMQKLRPASYDFGNSGAMRGVHILAFFDPKRQPTELNSVTNIVPMSRNLVQWSSDSFLRRWIFSFSCDWTHQPLHQTWGRIWAHFYRTHLLGVYLWMTMILHSKFILSWTEDALYLCILLTFDLQRVVGFSRIRVWAISYVIQGYMHFVLLKLSSS